MRPKRQGADNGEVDCDDVPDEVGEENNMQDNGTGSGKPLLEKIEDGMKDTGGEKNDWR